MAILSELVIHDVKQSDRVSGSIKGMGPRNMMDRENWFLRISHHKELLCVIFDLIRDDKNPDHFTEAFTHNADAHFERAVLEQR